MEKEISSEGYGMLPLQLKNRYARQYQEYVSHQPGSSAWVDISDTKSSYTNNTIRKVYRLITTPSNSVEKLAEDAVVGIKTLGHMGGTQPPSLINVQAMYEEQMRQFCEHKNLQVSRNGQYGKCLDCGELQVKHSGETTFHNLESIKDTKELIFNTIPFLDRNGDFFNIQKTHVLERMEEYATIKVTQRTNAVIELIEGEINSVCKLQKYPSTIIGEYTKLEYKKNILTDLLTQIKELK